MPISTAPGLYPNRWENPQESLGDFVGRLHDGAYQCWEARGRARHVFSQLNPEIKAHLEASGIPPTHNLSWSLYMIGLTRETAEPKLLLCSTDAKVRDHARQSIKDSNVLDKYPGVGLGHVSQIPIRQLAMSRASTETLLPPDQAINGAVLAEKPGTELGKRIFIVGLNEDLCYLRPATAGPIILRGGNYYQLTSAYPFHQNEDLSSSNWGYEYDFDGLSQYSEDDDSPDVDMASELAPSDKTGFGNVSPTVKTHVALTGKDTEGSPMNRVEHWVELAAERPEPLYVDSSQFQYFGKLALDSLARKNPTLDYALVQITPKGMASSNKLPPVNISDEFHWIPSIGDIKSVDIDIVVAMPSNPLAQGIVRATPTFIPVPGRNTFQKVHRIVFNLSWLSTDNICGAAVKGKHDDRFYGHIIVTGWPGPEKSFTYLVPAREVYEDIQAQAKSKAFVEKLPGAATIKVRDTSSFQKDTYGQPWVHTRLVSDSSLGLSSDFIIPQSSSIATKHELGGLLPNIDCAPPSLPEAIPDMDTWAPSSNFRPRMKRKPETVNNLAKPNECPVRKKRSPSYGERGSISQTVQILNDDHFEHVFQFCPFMLLRPSKFQGKMWSPCKELRKAHAHTVNHLIDLHGLIRAQVPPKRKYITKCASHDSDVKGKASCEACLTVLTWTDEQLLDPAHAGNAVCLRCYKLLPDKRALHHHLHLVEACDYEVEMAAVKKFKVIYAAFCSESEPPRYRPSPSECDAHREARRKDKTLPMARQLTQQLSILPLNPSCSQELAFSPRFLYPPLLPPFVSILRPQSSSFSGIGGNSAHQSTPGIQIDHSSTHLLAPHPLLPSVYPSAKSEAHCSENYPDDQHEIQGRTQPTPDVELTSLTIAQRPACYATNVQAKSWRAEQTKPLRKGQRYLWSQQD